MAVSNWDVLQEQSAVLLIAFMKGDDISSESFKKARVATSVLATFTRHEATESAKARTIIGVAKHITENKEEMRAYMALAMPDVKLLPAKKNSPLTMVKQ